MTSPASLSVVVFSNFEGACHDLNQARQIVHGFETITERYPEVVWTHMFNPIYLLGPDRQRECGQEFLVYLLSLVRTKSRTEVGLHPHMFYDLVKALGVKPRSFPHAGAPPGDCLRHRGLEGDGYDVLLTAYTASERERILEGCIESFEKFGLPRPTSFCAGYSAADPQLQSLIERLGFTTSFAAQIVPKGIKGVSYPPCWYELLPWAENLSPLSRPYRVGKESILPTSHGPYLDRLVEIPLNTDTDIRQPYLHGQPISRKIILDFHYEMVRTTGRSSCVALGVHEVYLGKDEHRGPVIEEMASNLEHVRGISRRGDVRVAFATASEVSRSVHEEAVFGERSS